jgi:hypothetical protein
MDIITRDGVTWELRAPRETHYAPRRQDGHLFLHANRRCHHLDTEDPVPVSPKIVGTLWEKEAASRTANENDVAWCEECASKQVDS